LIKEMRLKERSDDLLNYPQVQLKPQSLLEFRSRDRFGNVQRSNGRRVFIQEFGNEYRTTISKEQRQRTKMNQMMEEKHS